MQYQDRLQPPKGWAIPVGERLPVPRAQERGVLFRSLSGVSHLFGRSELPNIFPVLNTNRRLFWAWLFFASRLMPFGRLPATLREKVILRVAWNCRSRYELAQHLEIAQSVGVSDQEILQATRPLIAQPDAYSVALYGACDNLCAKEPIEEEHWQQLVKIHSHKEIVEFLTLVGHYEMVAGILINAKVPLEASIEDNFRRFQEENC